jgi:adenylate kinase
MRLIIIGPQGAGKGTQGGRLAVRYGIAHVATGDLLRAATRAGTPLGVEAKGFMERGELVPDALVLDMIRDRLVQTDAAPGFLLDGFPRNDVQARALRVLLDEVGERIDAVISLEVSDAVLIERLSARRTCPVCGTPYTVALGEPETCPKDGATLVQRKDDTPEAIARRLSIFHEQTQPLIEFYEDQGLVVHVDGVGAKEEVEARIAKELEAAR